MTDQTNPQSLVDAALGTEPVTTTMPPTTVAPVPPAPLAPLTPLTQPVQPEPVVPPVPSPMPTPTPASVPMGDDTPLAFAMPAPTTAPVMEQPKSSYLPPVPPVPPAPTMAPEQPKKKSKTGLIIGGVVALLLFVLGGGGGYYYLTQGKTPQIAVTGYSKSAEDKAASAPNGYHAEIADNQAVWGGYGGGAEVVDPNTGLQTNVGTLQAQALQNNTATTSISSDGSTFGGMKDIGDIPGMYKVYSGTNEVTGYRPINAPNVFKGLLTATINSPNSPQAQAMKSIYGITPATAGAILEKIDLGLTWAPPNVGSCTAAENGGVAGSCKVWHWTKCASGGIDGYGCGVMNKSAAGEDVFVPEVPTTTVTPTMSCTGLSSVPDVTVATAPPVIGTKITFTCTGAVVPASAGTLSYKYRFNINNGTYTPMTSNTLTITACGSYSVECQACATLNGVLTCDPVWTGATTQ